VTISNSITADLQCQPPTCVVGNSTTSVNTPDGNSVANVKIPAKYFGKTISVFVHVERNQAHGDSSCGHEYCGDGIIQAYEQCDDGNKRDNDGCSSSCKREYCGDGIVQAGEQCDDGNFNDADGCSSSCIAGDLAPCPAGFHAIGTSCLLPAVACAYGSYFYMNTMSCAQPLICGNGIMEGHEECDDGNTMDDDGCSHTCRVEYCGDGIIQSGEACDDANSLGGDGCSASCEVEVCGDGSQVGDVVFRVGTSSTKPTVLTMGSPFSMNPKAHEGLLSNQQLYEVAVGGGGDAEVTVTMKDTQHSARVHLGTNTIPSSGTEQQEDVLGFNQTYGDALCSHVACSVLTCFVFVRAWSAFQIQGTSSQPRHDLHCCGGTPCVPYHRVSRRHIDPRHNDCSDRGRRRGIPVASLLCLRLGVPKEAGA